MEWLRLALGYTLIFLMPLVICFWTIIHLGHGLWKQRPLWQAYSAAFVALVCCGWVVFAFREVLLGTDLGMNIPIFGAGLAVYVLSLIMARSVRRHLALRTFAGVPEIKGETVELITSGPFGVVRHPRYLMVIVGVIGWALMTHYSGVYWVAVASIVGLVFIARLEERELKTRFGKAYAAYQREVPMLVPRLGDVSKLWTDDEESEA